MVATLRVARARAAVESGGRAGYGRARGTLDPGEAGVGIRRHASVVALLRGHDDQSERRPPLKRPVDIPKAKLKHHLTPTASMLVSRGWVLREVERVPDLDGAARTRLVDALCAWEPPRRHGVRTNVIVWVTLLCAAMLFGALGLPGWLGFLVAMAGLIGVARALVVRQMRWKLGQLLRDREGAGGAQATL